MQRVEDEGGAQRGFVRNEDRTRAARSEGSVCNEDRTRAARSEGSARN